jgi:hypothetical protein
VQCVVILGEGLELVMHPLIVVGGWLIMRIARPEQR